MGLKGGTFWDKMSILTRDKGGEGYHPKGGGGGRRGQMEKLRK